MSIRVGRWDCPTCFTEGVLGPETKCPNCGSPRPKDVKFYLSEDSEIVQDEEKIKEAKAGADWVCSHCESHNKSFATVCNGCGSPRDDASEGDKELQEKSVWKEQQDKKEAPSRRLPPKPAAIPVPRGGGHLKKVLFVVALIVVALIWLASLKSETEITVDKHLWTRIIELQEQKIVTERGWDIPEGGQMVSQQQAIRKYNKVQDGTKVVTETVKVKVGTERYVCDRIDKGNGYFEDKYCERPVYKNEKRKKTVPKYKEVPVYDTQYTYRIPKWVKRAPVRASGIGKEGLEWPQMPTGVPADKIKQGKKSAKYLIKFTDSEGKTQQAEIPFQLWESTQAGDALKADKATIGGGYSNFRKK